MAVTGPRVGSSAKAETGESSMKAAGLKLRLTVPFKMSQMIGRSIRGLVYTLDQINTGSDWPKYYTTTKADNAPKADFKLGETGDALMTIIGVGARQWFNGEKNVYLQMSDPSLVNTYTRLVLSYAGKQYILVPGQEFLEPGHVFVPRSQDFNAFYDLVVTNIRKEMSFGIDEIV